jgi:hypothetical protein
MIVLTIMLFSIKIDIFYPTGEPISLQSLRCSPGRLGRLAVVYYSLVGHFIDFAAPDPTYHSTRE